MRRTTLFRLACSTALVWLGAARPARADDLPPRYSERWFYASHNELVEQNVDRLVALIQRAGKSGYNGLLLADYKFNILERMPPHYFKNVARVRDAAAAAGIEIIPAVFPIGYSAGLLAHDPNLAEGLPVEAAPFVVRARQAVLDAQPAAHIVNGDLEQARGDRFTGFSFQDDPGATSFADHEVVHHGKSSCRMQDIGKHNRYGNCRLSQRVKVRPHACYRLSCWVKTRDLEPANGFRLLALSTDPGARPLTFFEGRLDKTQDWKPLDVVFNSLDETEVQVYAGVWSGGSGTLWVDDIAIEELSLVNVLRREGCPLVVAAADGGTVYEEGRDYEPVRDPQLGQVPYAGEFDFGHDGAPIQLTAGSRIRDGAKLRVSWYHPVAVHGSQLMCCLTDPKVDALLRDQAQRVNALFEPKTFFMSHDEIRVANWCAACRARDQTPGQLLADQVRRSLDILRELNPRARVAVWSDMFDPNHNAVDHYYLVNGTLEGSWEGLPPDVLIANWNSGKAEASLRFFAERGHSQVIAGFYDGDLANFRKWDAASRGVRGVVGFMYTTWQNRYDLLESYGQAMRGDGDPSK